MGFLVGSLGDVELAVAYTVNATRHISFSLWLIIGFLLNLLVWNTIIEGYFGECTHLAYQTN